MNLRRIESNKEILKNETCVDAFFELSKKEPLKNFVMVLFSLGVYGDKAKWIPTTKDEVGRRFGGTEHATHFMDSTDIERTITLMKMIAFGGLI